MYIYNFVGGHNHADSVPVEDLIGTQKIETPPSGRGTVSRRRWAVNRVGLVVNSCHVAGFSGPFTASSARLGPVLLRARIPGQAGASALRLSAMEGSLRVRSDRLKQIDSTRSRSGRCAGG